MLPSDYCLETCFKSADLENGSVLIMIERQTILV